MFVNVWLERHLLFVYLCCMITCCTVFPIPFYDDFKVLTSLLLYLSCVCIYDRWAAAVGRGRLHGRIADRHTTCRGFCPGPCLDWLKDRLPWSWRVADRPLAVLHDLCRSCHSVSFYIRVGRGPYFSVISPYCITLRLPFSEIWYPPL